MDLTKEPSIPVRFNRRSMMMKTANMNGAHLHNLRRIRKSELSSTTRFTNKSLRFQMEKKLEFFFKEQSMTIEHIKKGQRTIYDSMRGIHKEKRRMQIQVHRRRQEELKAIADRESKLIAEKIRHRLLSKRVVGKFKENVRKRKAEREEQAVKTDKKGKKEKKRVGEVFVWEAGEAVAKANVNEGVIRTPSSGDQRSDVHLQNGSRPALQTNSDKCVQSPSTSSSDRYLALHGSKESDRSRAEGNRHQENKERKDSQTSDGAARKESCSRDTETRDVVPSLCSKEFNRKLRRHSRLLDGMLKSPGSGYSSDLIDPILNKNTTIVYGDNGRLISLKEVTYPNRPPATTPPQPQPENVSDTQGGKRRNSKMSSRRSIVVRLPEIGAPSREATEILEDKTTTNRQDCHVTDVDNDNEELRLPAITKFTKEPKIPNDRKKSKPGESKRSSEKISGTKSEQTTVVQSSGEAPSRDRMSELPPLKVTFKSPDSPSVSYVIGNYDTNIVTQAEEAVSGVMEERNDAGDKERSETRSHNHPDAEPGKIFRNTQKDEDGENTARMLSIIGVKSDGKSDNIADDKLYPRKYRGPYILSTPTPRSVSSDNFSYRDETDRGKQNLSLVILNKKRRKHQEQRRHELLNSEEVVQYEKSKDGKIVPALGHPFDRETFQLPSRRERYKQKKLLQGERQTALGQQLKMAVFLNEFESK